ncbi:KH domain-containing protein At4g18375-like [Rutidosis leptorrhynchoides]|uniref:KH domain-containing protein At4g18375-like n=1 Tax=Rutidosis leptorrhynchoides TaxID=125765 RepID=UPI003A9A226D
MRHNTKRTHPHGNYDRDKKNQKRRLNDNEEQGNDEMVVYRILCPDRVIGSVIGKSGKVINSIRQETRAKVKVVDLFPGAKDRVITIYCYIKQKDDIDIDDDFTNKEPLCAAQDALLRVHAAISNSISSTADSDKRRKDNVEECHILAPSSQSANIIGKAGANIKKLRGKTRANIRVSGKDPKDPTHSCAMDFDNFIMITGESEAVKKALFAVSAIMYKFTPREDLESIPDATPSIIIPSDVPLYPSGGLYTNTDPLIPPRSISSILGHVPEFQGFADTGSAWPIYASALPMVSDVVSGSNPEELIIRVLCPASKIGRVIGKGGATIKSIRQASGARIEVDDTHADRDDTVITVIASEAHDDLKSMAVEAVLLLQAKINDEEVDTVDIRILVPSKVIGCLIGKGGSIINEIRKRTKADIGISKCHSLKVSKADNELVEVAGEVGYVRDALIQIVLRLRDDALKVQDGGRNHSSGAHSLYSSGSGLSMPSLLSSVPHVAPLGYDHRHENGSGVGLLSSSSLYGYGSLPMEDRGYGSVSPYSTKFYGGGFSPPSALEVLIPSNAIGRVVGKAGANISNIRKISGAMVEISESKSSRSDRVALISGTPEQKRTAESLVQAFIMAT